MRIIIVLMVILSLLLVSCSNDETVNEPETNNSPQVNAPAAQGNTTAPLTAPTSTAQKIACYTDSDCGVRTVKNAYCFQGNPVGDMYSWQCLNPGTENAKCDQIYKNGILAECGDTSFCYKGECVKYTNCTDSDNGLNFTVKGAVKTNDNNVYEDKCDDGILIEYYCSDDDRAFSDKKDCIGECSRGACVDEAEENSTNTSVTNTSVTGAR